MIPEAVSTCGANTTSGRRSRIVWTTSSIGHGANGACGPSPTRLAFITISLFAKATGEPVDAALVTDRGLRKVGFCLTDLVRAPAALRPENAARRIGYPVIGCGTRGSEEFTMGISPGYGDD